MIRYSLLCPQDHGFEAWFRDSAAFEQQAQDRHVDCPHCGSTQIRKALMAPAVRTSRSRLPAPEPETPPQAAAPADASAVVAVGGLDQPPALDDPKGRHLRMLLRELHAKVRAQADNVGSGFSEEARRIHEGEKPARPIYGTATGEEARALIEDGIEIMPLPPLPDERN